MKLVIRIPQATQQTSSINILEADGAVVDWHDKKITNRPSLVDMEVLFTS